MKSTLITLEFNKIIDILENYAVTYLGKNKVHALEPSYDKENVMHMLKETNQAFLLLYRKGAPPLYDIENITISLKALKSHSSLTAKALLNIGNILRNARELKEFFYNDESIDLSEFNLLKNYFDNLYNNKNIENIIFTSILDENTISDNASKTLANLRKNRKNLESGIKDSLNKTLHSYSKYIMEPIITIRNERYVIPVKEAYRNEVKGFIHDVSSSGSTVFIEPIGVFELNNKINDLKLQENLEIERILQNISSMLFPYVDELEKDLSLIQHIDFIFAKAKYSKDIDGIFPNLNDNKEIKLYGARHPLISKESVVPVDIIVGNSYSSLVITGPNTGGKTVTLKTIGLLTLMACSGLAIPAKENSSVYVFDQIFADIGDEQSIAESLSTFSSHMTNIIYIINNCNKNSLILLDELGSGTDPLEGSSLAISILEYLHNLGCISISTTHYEEVKQYALVTDGFENASSEFDIENLKPTYRLLIGIPGKSNAFAISKRLGLPQNILDRAKECMNQDSINFEDLLKNIYDDKLKIEKEKDEIEKNLNQIALLRKSLEKEKNNITISQNSNIEKAKMQARDILLEAKEKAQILLKDLNTASSNADTKKANSIYEELNRSLKKLYEVENTKPVANSFSKDMLHVGDNLQLRGFTSPATIISLSGKKNVLQVQIGSMKMQTTLDAIEKILPKFSTSNNNSNISHTSIKKSKQISPELNVIGTNVEEACFLIDKYLDDCFIARLESVRIVHGKGTGKLREGIHKYLHKNPHVKSFRLGTFGEGEMGVTVVTLKY